MVPETDPSTYNGKDGRRCRASIRRRPKRSSQYEQDAIKPEFRWSWRNHQFEYDIYKRYTDKRNDANRAAVRDLLVVGANHILSMFDAFTTARLQVRTGSDGQTRVGAQLTLVSQITGRRSAQLL